MSKVEITLSAFIFWGFLGSLYIKVENLKWRDNIIANAKITSSIQVDAENISNIDYEIDDGLRSSSIFIAITLKQLALKENFKDCFGSKLKFMSPPFDSSFVRNRFLFKRKIVDLNKPVCYRNYFYPKRSTDSYSILVQDNLILIKHISN